MLPKLLIVDDEVSTREGLKQALEGSFDCYLASNSQASIDLMKVQPVELILTDLRLGGADSGLKILEACQKMKLPPPVIIMTAYGAVETAVEAIRQGAWHFVTKPLNLEEVELLLKKAIRGKQLESENQVLKKQIQQRWSLGDLLGKSDAIKDIFSLVEQVAATRATVLIEGESGTGKEIVSRAIHELSNRADQELVIVNCVALSPSLLESELFGHEKGAFTGATQKRIGRFELANKGTIILDEIGEIEPTLQVKLLRVLSERTIDRVGSGISIEVDVRVIAATNQNLEQLVEEGRFRKDLYFRLNGVKIEMPSLRERAEDIPLLANAFLEQIAKENKRPVTSFSAEVLEAFQHYDWPGNVRELRALVEHGVIMSQQEEVVLSSLPKNWLKKLSEFTENTAYSSSKLIDFQDFNLSHHEKMLIENALLFSQGNKTKAAKLLGISRRTLQRKCHNQKK